MHMKQKVHLYTQNHQMQHNAQLQYSLNQSEDNIKLLKNFIYSG